MARRESQAVAGFYPTPPRVVESIVGALAPGSGAAVVMDPCAGEGHAAAAVAGKLGQGTRQLLVELEETRAASLSSNPVNRGNWVLQGDFFFLEPHTNVADVLWLNPPYDLDKVYGRLEEKFLHKALPYLQNSGVIVFIIPHYALFASMSTIAQYLSDVTCFRFPDPEYGAYKQVVLMGRKVQRETPDPDVQDLVQTWARAPEELPTEPTRDYTVVSAVGSWAQVPHLKIAGYDRTATASLDPWTGPRGLILGLGIEDDPLARFNRTFPVATRPRAAHLAAALAAGIFNGTRVVPNEESSGLPPVLLKGTFDKAFRTVEEKYNKDGKKVSEVQVQQPKLSVVLLDLNSGLFHDVRQTADIAVCPDVTSLSMADLLEHYGRALMRVMLEACPVLHDPQRGDVGVDVNPYVARPLYDAQVGIVQASLKMYEQDPRRGVIVLGELGSGKTSCALATMAVLKSQRALVVCPPHLLDGWQDQIAAVLPRAKVHVLSTISDVDAFFSPPEDMDELSMFFRELALLSGPADPVEDMRVGILSREKAKLGHGWTSIRGRCPRCGVKLLVDFDYAAKRARCDAKLVHPINAAARWLRDNACILSRYLPRHPAIRQFTRKMRLPSRPARKPDAALDDILLALDDLIEPSANMRQWMTWTRPPLARNLKSGDVADLYLALRPDEVHEEMFSGMVQKWPAWRRFHLHLHGEGVYPHGYYGHYDYRHVDGHPTYRNIRLGSKEALEALLDAVVNVAEFKRDVCDEFLYQAVPEPRRYSLATYIAKKHRDAFDFLVLDECHEFASDGSAQTHAAQRLLNTGCKTMLLSGSFTNGYANSAFMNLWGTSPAFRAEFDRANLTGFIDRFGYWKRIVSEEDFNGAPIEFGSQSDRVTRSRKAGVAPGIHPLFQLEYLLPSAVTLQKEDLKIGIPPLRESSHCVPMLQEQSKNFQFLTRSLMDTIKLHRNNPELSGKLWGAMAELPAYLDLACVGNVPDEGRYQIVWPDTAEEYAGQVIAEVPILDPATILPKEQDMLDVVRGQVNAGRPVLVLGWHTSLLPRLVQLLKDAGLSVAHLEASRVPTQKRQRWIDTEVIAKRKDVLVANPVTVQTGLNNLVYFATEYWVENPGCNPISYTQTVGRIDRIGQTRPTQVNFPLYSGQQESLYRLLQHKVGVLKAVDGLDPEAALRAAGVIDEAFSGFTVGKYLYDVIMRQDNM